MGIKGNGKYRRSLGRIRRGGKEKEEGRGLQSKHGSVGRRGREALQQHKFSGSLEGEWKIAPLLAGKRCVYFVKFSPLLVVDAC